MLDKSDAVMMQLHDAEMHANKERRKLDALEYAITKEKANATDLATKLTSARKERKTPPCRAWQLRCTAACRLPPSHQLPTSNSYSTCDRGADRPCRASDR